MVPYERKPKAGKGAVKVPPGMVPGRGCPTDLSTA